MSVKLALAKLSATAAGTALLAGGAVHVAEKQITDTPQYKSGKVQSVKAQPVRYIKERRPATRRVERVENRQRRIVRREVECEEVGGPGAHYGAGMDRDERGAGRIVETRYDARCAPAYRMAMAAVPAPLVPMGPVGGGGSSSGGVTVIGGSGGFGGGFGGGFFGGFFGGGGGSSGSVTVTSTTSTSGSSSGSSGGDINID
ncbi:MAG: hypothetical protein KDD90_01670, partial [Sphingomonadaceae bacterium]|nr:hypothetical protein [Sphingomonadaceae bacterium]